LPENAAEIGLLANFPKDGTPRPRYLGHTTNPETADGLKQAIPSMTWRPGDETAPICDPSDHSQEAFKKKIELLMEGEKKKKAATREKKKIERIAKQQAWNCLIKRVQRYLGIRGLRQCHNAASKGSGTSSVGYDIGKQPSFYYVLFLGERYCVPVLQHVSSMRIGRSGYQL
jgi:hypothetical protein